jgi:hypothetical protein
MTDDDRQDIRRLLKTFGIRADEAIIAYQARHPDTGTLRLRLTLEDETDYGSSPPGEKLFLEVKGEVRR